MSYQPNDPADLARFDAIPALGRFARAAESLIDDKPESFWKCEEAFRELAQTTTFVRDLVRYELTRLRRDPSYVARECTESRIALLIHPNVELGMVHLHPRPDGGMGQLSTIGDHVMIGCYGPGTLHMDVYRHSRAPSIEVFDPTNELDVKKSIAIAPFETHAFRAGVDAVVERSPVGSACMLLFVYRNAVPIRWMHDPATKKPVRAVSADQQTYRMDFAARTLARMDYEPAVPTLEDMYNHPRHFVRWAAVRELVLLDPVRGRALLERAASDPHPHVRNAAKRTLEKMNAANTLAQSEDRATRD
jgi:hypothetical protein